MSEQVVRTDAGLLDTFFRACPFPIVVDDLDRVITLIKAKRKSEPLSANRLPPTIV